MSEALRTGGARRRPSSLPQSHHTITSPAPLPDAPPLPTPNSGSLTPNKFPPLLGKAGIHLLLLDFHSYLPLPLKSSTGLGLPAEPSWACFYRNRLVCALREGEGRRELGGETRPQGRPRRRDTGTERREKAAPFKGRVGP